MARTKRGTTTHARHKKVMERAKGYRGRGNSVFTVAIERVEKGLQYAYRDRRTKKRNFRALRSEEHTSELQSLMRISYAVFCLKKKNTQTIDKQNIKYNI